MITYATLYRSACFDVLPELEAVNAVVTDPPVGIGYAYRSHDDAPEEYEQFMGRLVPDLVRVTRGGPCFVWQSPIWADRWHRFFSLAFRIVAGCKLYPKRGRHRCYSWNPIVFWSGRSLLHQEVPHDWHVDEVDHWNREHRGNPVSCPRPLGRVDIYKTSMNRAASHTKPAKFLTVFS